MIDLFDLHPQRHTLKYRIWMAVLRFIVLFGTGWLIGELLK
jgi:hypothetical protein